MRFYFPRFPAEFEIPDDWWAEAGMPAFSRHTKAFRSTTANEFALCDIEPPFRLPSAPLDWRGFDHARLVSILVGFANDAELPPIDLLILPPLADISRLPFKYRVLDGFHRFYASIAVGFDSIPANMRDMLE